MNAAPLFPFYDLFCAVRTRLGLTISDYMALLQALEYALKAGSGIRLIDELVTLCQLLWAKTPEACDEIEAAVRSHALRAAQDYHEHLIRQSGEQAEAIQSRQDLEALVAAWARREEATPPAHTPQDAFAPTQPEPRAERDSTPLPAAEPDAPSPSEQAGGVETAHVEIPSPETYQQMVAVQLPLELASADKGAQVYAVPPEKYRVLPRRIRHLWRLYRLPQRSGANREFSLPATIASIERHGGLPVPIYRPRMGNQARVLLLVDVGRYMDGYQRDIEVLVSAFVGSAFHRRQVLYFENVPERDDSYPAGDELGGWELYADKALEKPVRLTDIRAALGHSGVMIISDAGAAGKRQRHYLNTMTDFVSALKGAGCRVVWLNPHRYEGWQDTAAEKLQQKLHMHPYSTRGLEAAINELRGFVIA